MQDDLHPVAEGDGVSVHSGFPNPALEQRQRGTRLALDLNQLLVKRPSSTYLFRMNGHTWADQGMYDGDIIVVDRAQSVRPSDLIVAWRDTSLIVGRYHQLATLGEPWGVVTAVIHQYRSS